MLISFNVSISLRIFPKPKPSSQSFPSQGMVSPFAVEMLLPAFLNGLAVKAKPPQKEATLQIISALAAKAPRAVGYLLVNLECPVADLTCDIKKEAGKGGWPKMGRSW